MRRFTALERALTLLRDPVCVARMRNEALPRDVSTVLRVLARDAEAEAVALASTAKPLDTVLEAAELYVTQVLFHSTKDPYRILGATPSASRAELRSNLALLLRWLHPDVAGPKHRGMTERVIGAWNELKTEDTRNALDENLARRRRSRHSRCESHHRHPYPSREPGRASALSRSPTQRGAAERNQPWSKRKLAVMIVLTIIVGACYFQGGALPIALDAMTAFLQSDDAGPHGPVRAAVAAESIAKTHQPPAAERCRECKAGEPVQ